MHRGIASLSPQAEFAIVLLVAFGWFIYVSLHHFLFGIPGFVVSNAGKFRLVALEVVLFASLGYFLYERGWTLERIGLKPTWTDTGIGIGLALAVYLTSWLARSALYEVSPSFAGAAVIHGTVLSNPSPVALLAVAAVNPLYEEFFVSGYIITSLKEKYGTLLAVNTSFTIRILYHLYQGIGGLFAIVPMGLLFAAWYASTRRLWPLIVGHAALNLYASLHYLQLPLR